MASAATLADQLRRLSNKPGLWPDDAELLREAAAALAAAEGRVDAARAEEREACAQVVDDLAAQRSGLESYLDLRNAARSIRARGEEPDRG